VRKVAIIAMTRIIPFNVFQEAFAFKNSWQYEGEELPVLKGLLIAAAHLLPPNIIDLIPFGRLILDGIILGMQPGGYGLCGGMAFAALDYYRAGLLIPRGDHETDNPHRDPTGSSLRTYIWDRLLDSIRDNGIKFVGWKLTLQLPGWLGGGSGRLLEWTRSEWPLIKRHLDNGEVWPIGLAFDQLNILDDHEVLAYGYEDLPDGRIKIYIYEMNCPAHLPHGENTIIFDLTGNRPPDLSCPHDPNTLVGFFPLEYQPVNPSIMAVGISQGVSAGGSNATLGETRQIRFTVRNNGFHNSPDFALCAEAKTVPGNVSLGVLTEGMGASLSQGNTRQFVQPMIMRTSGTIRIRAFSKVDNGRGGETAKVLPAIAPGAFSSIDILVGEAPGSWNSIGYQTTRGRLRVGTLQDGRIQLFVRGQDNALWYTSQVRPSVLEFTQWASLGGSLAGNPAVASNSDGRLEVFAVASDNNIRSISQTAQGSDAWGEWQSLGGDRLVSDPAVASNSDGRLEVFAVASDNRLWHTWQTAPSNGWSMNWEQLGSLSLLNTSPSALIQSNGRIKVLVIDNATGLLTINQTLPSNGWETDFSNLGRNLSLASVSLGRNSNGTLVAFGIQSEEGRVYFSNV